VNKLRLFTQFFLTKKLQVNGGVFILRKKEEKKLKEKTLLKNKLAGGLGVLPYIWAA
jgi:hypothetical protein